MNECYIRGSTIKYLRIPDEVIDLVKEDVQAKTRRAEMNKGNRNQQGGNRGGGQQSNRGNFGGGNKNTNNSRPNPNRNQQQNRNNQAKP